MKSRNVFIADNALAFRNLLVPDDQVAFDISSKTTGPTARTARYLAGQQFQNARRIWRIRPHFVRFCRLHRGQLRRP